MDASAEYELYLIQNELRSIISELESISAGVRQDFVGIGNDLCASSIDRVTEQYRHVLYLLNNMDTTTVTESYASAHGE